MTESNQKKLLRIYRILFSLTTAVVGLVFILQLWGIYRSQPQHAFSRASIRAALLEILPIVLLWLVCFILNIVCSRLYSQERVKLKAKINPSTALSSMKKRFVNGGKEVAGVRKTRILRYVVAAVGGIAITVCLLWGISYLFDKNYVVKRSLAFFKETNGVADRTLSMLPWLLLAAAVAVAVALLEEYLQKRELSLLQAALLDELRRKKVGEMIENPLVLENGASRANNGCKEKWKTFCKAKEKQLKIALWVVRGVLCVSAVVLIVLGINWGGMSLVFEKARSICQQCIGLG